MGGGSWTSRSRMSMVSSLCTRRRSSQGLSSIKYHSQHRSRSADHLLNCGSTTYRLWLCCDDWLGRKYLRFPGVLPGNWTSLFLGRDECLLTAFWVRRRYPCRILWCWPGHSRPHINQINQLFCGPLRIEIFFESQVMHSTFFFIRWLVRFSCFPIVSQNLKS
jgi:hypothetical protein